MTAPLFATLAMVVASSSCCLLDKRPKPKVFTRQEEAGSGHIAVLSVARWDDALVASLQPQFPMTPAKALEDVLPTTQLVEEKSLDTFRALLSVGLPTSSSTVSDVTTTTIAPGTDPATTRTITDTQQSGPGTAPALPAEIGTAAGSLAGRPKTLEGTLGTDPVLRHALATAYYQEVQLLNRYVKDAAIRSGYEPYLVRLQLSLMPSARNEPYDAYTTVSFFPGDGHSTIFPTVMGGPVGQEQCMTPRKPVIVLPLLSTDNLEASFSSRTSEALRQYGLALSGLLSNVGVQANLGRTLDRLLASVGNDYNSLFSVARLTENTIRVRMGARVQNQTQYAMVPQTHTISLVVLLGKCDVEPVDLVARTEFVHATDGTLLPMRNEQELDQLWEKLFTGSEVLRAIEPSKRKELALLVGSNQYAKFCSTYEEAGGTLGLEDQSWTLLTSANVGSQFSATSFEPPQKKQVELPSQGQILLVDDGENQMSASLRRVQHAQGKPLSSSLILTFSGAGAPGPIELPATTAVFDATRATIELVFPSFSRVRLPDAKPITPELLQNSSIEVTVVAADKTQPYPAQRVLITPKALPPTPAVEIKAPSVLKTQPGKIEAALTFVLKKNVDWAGKKITLSLQATKDGKVTSGLWKATPTATLKPTGEIEYTVPGDFAGTEIEFKVELDQLEDKSTLEILAKVDGSLTPGKKTIDIIVAPPPPK